jgi:hybrid cluster-associated redox disulfide protein
MEPKKSKQIDGKMKINKKMSFAEILTIDRELALPLMESGMHCVGCPMSQMESLEDGALAHGLNPDELVNKLNKKLEEKNKKGGKK